MSDPATNLPATADNPHQGHRERLRKRFMESGLDGFASHEVMELLLTFSRPRINVNELGHSLIDRFGSISGVRNASAEELLSIPGIGPQTACLIRLTAAIERMSAIEEAERDTSPLDTVQKMHTYLRGRFVGLSVERVYLLLLDNSLRPIECVNLGDGTVSGAHVSVRRIIELALLSNAASVVLAHNHPRGIPIPSADDIAVTETILQALELAELAFLEHFIFTEHSSAPMLRGRCQAAKVAARIGRDPQAFSATFYGNSPITYDEPASTGTQ